MVTGCLIKACNKVRAAGTGRARAYTEAAGQFGLSCSGECRTLLMPHPDPLYLAAADRITQRIEGITNQAEDLLNTDLFEHADQDVCYHLSHLGLLSLLTGAVRLFGLKKIYPDRWIVIVHACFRRVRLFTQLKHSKFWQRARTAVLSARVLAGNIGASGRWRNFDPDEQGREIARKGHNRRVNRKLALPIMSALGQKQTYAVQKGMSALPPIATSIALKPTRVMNSRRLIASSEAQDRASYPPN